MWRFLAFGLALTFCMTGTAQKCVQKDSSARVPLSQTRQMLCQIVENPELNRNVDEWINLALSGVMGLSKQDVFVTYLDICPEKGGPPQFGHVQGNEPQVASGVIQPFLAATLFHKEGGALPEDLGDDVAAMLSHGDFDATNRLIDDLVAAYKAFISRALADKRTTEAGMAVERAKTLEKMKQVTP